MSGLSPRERLVETMLSVYSSDEPRPLASLEEFFEGNDEPGSIGYNLPDPCGPQDFQPVLTAIRSRPDVADVLVVLVEVFDSGWPVTDTILIVTTADQDTVLQWFPEELAPDDLRTTARIEPPAYRAYPVPAGHRVVAAWFD